MKYRLAILFVLVLIIVAALLLVTQQAGAGDRHTPFGDVFKTLQYIAPRLDGDKITSTPCVGDPANCAPLATVTPTATEYMCPLEWCPNPPEGERCHCPIIYTLIAVEAEHER